jgi:hypothetical protein
VSLCLILLVAPLLMEWAVFVKDRWSVLEPIKGAVQVQVEGMPET